MKIKNCQLVSKRLVFFVAALLQAVISFSQTSSHRPEVIVSIDGNQHYQQLEGFGVNINTSWWLNGDYQNTDAVKPAIDILADKLGATIFRAVIEEMDWESVNDNNDPGIFNWNYYDSLFSTRKFKSIWNTLHYLNQKGITKDLIISFMGSPPASKPLLKVDPGQSWMGKTNYDIRADKEDEFVETIAALLYFARKKENIQFGLVSPMNETDIVSTTMKPEHPEGLVEGPNMPDPVQVARVIKKLGQKLDLIGLNDIRFVAPDAAGDGLFGICLDEMVKDPYIMGKLACWGVHDYGNDASNYQKIVSRNTNPNKSYWITETAGIENLFGQLDDNPTSLIFWDGFDCVYQHAIRNGYGSLPPNDWCFWFGEKGKPLIAYNSGEQAWIPRKQYYEYAQLFKFIHPGALRIGSSSDLDSVKTYAFLNPDQQLVIVIQNRKRTSAHMHGNIFNLNGETAFETYFTDSLNNLVKSNDLVITSNSFSASLPAGSVVTFAGKTKVLPQLPNNRLKPEPSDWYAGDIHVHRDCGGPVEGILPESEFTKMMEPNNLAVISVLADMGDAEVKDSKTDLPKVTGKDAPQSVPGRTIHYDAEWHWDPFGTTFEHKALGGHIVLLGLKEAHQIWDESTFKILEYGHKQDAIVGFCHTEYLNDTIQNNLNCCIPVEYPVEAALGTIDFFSEDVFGSSSPNNGNYNADATIHAYYRLLNCGFRIGLAAGTDYPCNGGEPFGTLLTYVNVQPPFTYRKWVEGIRNGKTVVTRNGHDEFIDLKVNNKYEPGDNIRLKVPGDISAEIVWTSVKPLTGSLELILNGKVIARHEGTAKPGEPILLKTKVKIGKSGWLCARRMDSLGHQTHTAPVYVTLNNQPVRASAEDAQYFVKWIDNLLEKTSPGHEWNQYFTHDLDIVRGRYKNARAVYEKIAKEAARLNN